MCRRDSIWPVHCVGDSWGAQLHDDLKALADAPRVRKGVGGEDGYSGFTVHDVERDEDAPTELEGLLRERGVERVIVVGLATDYCVRHTVLDALKKGWLVTLLTDAVSAVDLEPDAGARALDEMRAAGAALRASADLDWS